MLLSMLVIVSHSLSLVGITVGQLAALGVMVIVPISLLAVCVLVAGEIVYAQAEKFAMS